MLFAYIMLNHKRPLCRDVLMDRFWPHHQPDSSRNSLNVALHAIRQTLQELDPVRDFILFKDDCYGIHPDINIFIDAESFLGHWQRARTHEASKNGQAAIRELEAARELYTGEFLEDDLYDEWASMQRENFREMYLAVLDRLSENYLHMKEPQLAATLCESILEKDNCREDIHRRLMLCYYYTGCRDKALRQFKKCTEVLLAELEVEPTHATRELYSEIKNDRVLTNTI